MIFTSVVMYSQNYIFNKGKWQLEPIIVYLWISCLVHNDNYFLTNSLISNHIIGVKVQKARKEQKLAMSEYYEKHGGGGHH